MPQHDQLDVPATEEELQSSTITSLTDVPPATQAPPTTTPPSPPLPPLPSSCSSISPSGKLESSNSSDVSCADVIALQQRSVPLASIASSETSAPPIPPPLPPMAPPPPPLDCLPRHQPQHQPTVAMKPLFWKKLQYSALDMRGRDIVWSHTSEPGGQKQPIIVFLPELATLRVKCEKCCRVTNQIVYHNTFDLPHSTSH